MRPRFKYIFDKLDNSYLPSGFGIRELSLPADPPQLLKAGVNRSGKGGHSGAPSPQCPICRRNTTKLDEHGRRHACLNINCEAR